MSKIIDKEEIKWQKKQKKIIKRIDRFIDIVEKAHKRAGKSKLKFD